MEIPIETAARRLPKIRIQGTIVLMLASSTADAAVVINEIDYDQPGSDIAEFVELFNSDINPVTLDGYSLELVNGSNGAVYRSLDLSGHTVKANDYLVVCGDSQAVANCDIDLGASSWIQNGSSDAVALSLAGTLLDSVVYEGVGSFLAPWAEGGGATIADSNSVIMSIARLPDGGDTGFNAVDFGSGCLTPGGANISGTGDCSAPINPVPLPAAAWLFGSGLLGLAGIGRRASTARLKA